MHALGALLILSGQPSLSACDLDHIITARETHDALSRRAVEIIARASRTSMPSDPVLDEYVLPTTTVSFGAGDVGLNLSGIEGLRRFASVFDGGTYGFHGWDYMNRPDQACAVHEVTVRFVSRDGATVSDIDFIFDQGRVTSVMGWRRSLQSGPISE